MKSLRGKKSLVTGGASGIGRAIALALCRQGAEVYLLDIDPAALQATIQECQSLGAVAVGEVCDIGNPSQVSAAVANLLRTWGRLDLLINNAGVIYFGPTENMTPRQWDWLLGINLLGAIQLTRELLPTLLAQEESHILNVCSIYGLVGWRGTAAYNVSKFAMVGFSEALRAEYGLYRLGVTALCPGFVRTALLEKGVNGHPRKPMPTPPGFTLTTPEHVAEVALRAIRKNRGMVVITGAGHFMWFLKRLSPRFLGFLTREGWRKARRKKLIVPNTAVL